MREKLIIALDVSTEAEALKLVKQLNGLAGAFKVGQQLYNYTGPDFVRKLAAAGTKVFLDLKFHDIPNTTAMAAEAATDLGVFMFNLHASGGKKMLSSAATRAREHAAAQGMPNPLIIGVTVLTSMDETELQVELKVSLPLEDQVASLAILCQEAGLDGVVASAREITRIRQECSRNFIIVTPGIRPSLAAVHDQKRTATPAEALALGADYLVIGRPVTGSENPRDALHRIIHEITGKEGQ
ncbi:MAG TPA: orotidine-5'-phosphate decarboxylase [Candidatus Limnocylindrales bacterium]|nr:orotidine-5'-phosphate decarboxylase [Candidatus Limnocylindrales bacterium]